MPLSWVDIDLAALRHNFSEVRKRTGKNTRILGVVKSDAYGHGMIPVAKELVACGANFLGVSKFWEAQELRAHGIQAPILVLLGLEEQEMAEAIELDLRPTLFRLDHARRLSDLAVRRQTSLSVHLKVDTGMGRLGVPYEKVPSFLEEFLPLPGLKLEGVLSHFSSADEADKSYSELQIKRFRQILKLLADAGCTPSMAHIANSAGTLDLPHAHFQLVRPGITLYGSQPSNELNFPADLRPVMSFKSKVIQLKDLPSQHPIGYGCTFITQRPSKIATIPVGYDDGYARILSNRGQVLIGGRRAAVVGRVSMNMITVDVTDVPGVKEDDEVVLLGSQGEERISAEEIARLTNTISYEVYCSIGRHRYKFFHSASEN